VADQFDIVLAFGGVEMTVRMVNAMTRAICWTAGVVEGFMNGLIGVRGERKGPFDELRAALMGRHRQQILRALGAPPTASVGFGVSIVTGGAPPTYWQASTWYYPFDQGQRQAIAIRFVGDRAREVEFIGEAE